ncbi:EamA family transporter [Candidatus Saccharibacteria bacterium]|nr:EamA family transporter [Candidatus Saccharibacteria bacterium]
MELWLILTLVASVVASVSAFFDNYIIDDFFKERMPQALKCFYGPINLVTALTAIIIYFSLFTVEPIPMENILLLILSGIISAAANVPYYMALGVENTTGAIIFSQLYPVFYLLLGALFLNEAITSVQFIAFLLLLLAPMVIIFSTRRRGKKMEYRAGLLFLIGVIMSSFANILFVFAERGAISSTGNTFPIILAVALLFLGKGIFDVFAVATKKNWRVRAKNVMKASRNRVLVPIIVNSLIWLVVEYCIRRATVIGQVAIVSAVDKAVELLATFVLGLIFTILWPRFGREKLDRRTVMAHLIATVLAMAGIILVENPDIFSGIW